MWFPKHLIFLWISLLQQCFAWGGVGPGDGLVSTLETKISCGKERRCVIGLIYVQMKTNEDQGRPGWCSLVGLEVGPGAEDLVWGAQFVEAKKEEAELLMLVRTSANGRPFRKDALALTLALALVLAKLYIDCIHMVRTRSISDNM